MIPVPPGSTWPLLAMPASSPSGQGTLLEEKLPRVSDSPRQSKCGLQRSLPSLALALLWQKAVEGGPYQLGGPHCLGRGWHIPGRDSWESSTVWYSPRPLTCAVGAGQPGPIPRAPWQPAAPVLGPGRPTLQEAHGFVFIYCLCLCT